ncbi:MAG: nucleotide sugar dehydrogenase [Gammaproteobacteria bacterium]|nr:nucleotide sugar dehydrogenase [Gammaproteobacteria bacterium]
MNHNRKISITGLGYVGLPMAVEFGYQAKVIAFDINVKRIEELKKGLDRTEEVTKEQLAKANLSLTCDPSDLRQADFHIVAVPTPINEAKQPDLTPLLKASITIGKILKKGDIVVYESTVYPGATEEDCVPLLEENSGLKCGKDFFIGYSPERINPSDKKHNFATIMKVVSGQTPEILEIVADVYRSVVTAGIYKASSIKVAEAAKVIENTQRDLNIALINELAIIFEKLGIDTLEVLEAAGTKWNFLPFRPGLVGGHCIGVDPYYLTYKATKIGLHPQVVLAGRRVNDSMGKYVAEQTVKQLIHQGSPVKGAKVAILGLTFKENCPDLRNTRVVDIYQELKDYAIDVFVHDALADPEEAKGEYHIDLLKWDQIPQVDALIIAVAHDDYLNMNLQDYVKKLRKPRLIIDVKSILDRDNARENDIHLWRL